MHGILNELAVIRILTYRFYENPHLVKLAAFSNASFYLRACELLCAQVVAIFGGKEMQLKKSGTLPGPAGQHTIHQAARKSGYSTRHPAVLFPFLCLLFALFFAPSLAEGARGKKRRNDNSAAKARRAKVKKQRQQRKSKVGTKTSAMQRRVNVGSIRVPKNLADAGKLLLHRSTKTTQSMLAHPRFGKDYEATVRAAIWVASPEGQLVNEKLADLVNQEDRELTQLLSQKLEGLLETRKFFHPGSEYRTGSKRKVIFLSKDQRNRAETFAEDFDSNVRQKAQPNFDPNRLFLKAIGLAGAKSHQAMYSKWLMGTYRPPETDLPKATNLMALMEVRNVADPKAYSARYMEDFHSTVRKFSPPQRKRLYGHRIREALRKLFLDSSKPESLSQFENVLMRRYDLDIFSKILSYREIISRRDSIIESELSRVDLPANDISLLRQYYSEFFLQRFRDYLPTDREPVSAETLAGHQLFVLAQRSADIVRLRDTSRANEDSRATKRPSQEPISTLVSREQRMAAYREEQQEKKDQELQDELEPKEIKPATTKQVPPPKQPDSVKPLTMAEFEKLAATRSANPSVASSFADLYERLKEGSQKRVTLALSELFGGADRRMNSFEAGTVSKAHGFDVFYLRVHGAAAIRIYFIVDGVDGPVITGSQEKTGSDRQNINIRNAEKAGRKYTSRN